MKVPLNIKNSAPFLLALILGLALVPITLTGWNLAYYPGALGDSRFNLYILEHGYKFLTGQIGEYWNAPFMYPEPNVISYSDNLLGTVPIYSFFRLLGFEIFTAFQLWVISLFALNYTCFYFFAKYVFKNRYAAVIGAFVFAFSLANQASFAHVQVIPRFFIPLAFWMILRFSEEFNPKYFFLALLFMTGELYASIYLGLFTFLTGGLFLFIVILSSWKNGIPKFRIPRWWTAIILGLIINLAFISGLMYPYLLRSDRVLKTPYPDILNTLPTPTSFLYSKPGSLIWGVLSKVGFYLPSHWDKQLFPGGIAFISFLILLGFFIFKFRKLSGAVVVLFGTGLLIMLLFMRFGDFSLYQWIYRLPGYDSMRAMDRIIGIELLFFGIASGWVFMYIFRKTKKWQVPVFLITIGLLCFDNYVKPNRTFRTEKSIGWGRVQAVVDQMEGIPKNAVVSYEPDSIDRDIYVQLDGMLASQFCELRSINGYSATCPTEFGPYWHQPNAANRQLWLASRNDYADTLYVINTSGIKEVIDLRTFRKENTKLKEQRELDKIIRYIQTDKEWMNAIRKKAELTNLPVDTVLARDAKWWLNNQNEKKGDK